MRKTLLLLMLLSVKLVSAQFLDDFSDGNFDQNPTWNGQTSAFTINSAQQLQSALSANAQTITLATANALALNAKWEFTVQLNFDPTATNLARIYLVADQLDLKGPLNGYFLQIGETGATDSYDLYRQSGTVVTRIIDGPAKARANANLLFAKVRVTRNDLGQWELYTATDHQPDYQLEGRAIDRTHTHSNWFGVYCSYTVTRSNGFIFDDFKVTELVADVSPPSLVKASLIDELTVEVTFSEPVLAVSALVPEHYALSDFGSPVSVSATAWPHVYQLNYATALPSGPYQLVIAQVTDLKGNSMVGKHTVDFFYIKPYLAKVGDVVINEIFADPTPQVGLPAAEFVELRNTTNEYILLKGWKYADLTSTYTFAHDTIKPNAYLILTANADVALFSSYGKTLGLSPWPTLNNDKDVLKLAGPDGQLIDEVHYADTWYRDALKKQGGYSLELIDPANRCKGMQNWTASNAIIGGTPGQQNSVHQQQLLMDAPRLLNAMVLDAQTVNLVFSGAIDSLSAAKLTNYQINNGIGQPMAAWPLAPNFTVVTLKLATPLVAGVESLLTIQELGNCAGKLIDPAQRTATLLLTKSIGPGNLLISEVLFNPKNGGVDFVEIYNPTDQVFDLKELQLANADQNGNPANSKAVSAVTVLMPPKTYWVLTSNATVVQEHYQVLFPKQMVQLASMPTFNNDRGSVILQNEVVIDRFDYSEKNHLPLLKEVKGVSLERVSFSKPTHEPGNFRSAAASVGFATPTYQNSQALDPALLRNRVYLSSQTFSPDGDGFEDLLELHYAFSALADLATVNIYTDKGRLVKTLARNTSIAQSGSFYWDGTDDNGQPGKVGIYVIRFDALTLNGKTETFTLSCALAAKLIE